MYEVNRSVFLLIPLEPFWNWLQSLPGNHLDGLTLEDIQADANSEWPDLDADIFNEWFDIQLSTVITDLEHEPLAREAFQPINLN